MVPYQKVKREGDYYDDEENEKNKKLMKTLLDDETSIMSKNRGVNSEGSIIITSWNIILQMSFSDDKYQCLMLRCLLLFTLISSLDVYEDKQFLTKILRSFKLLLKVSDAVMLWPKMSWKTCKRMFFYKTLSCSSIFPQNMFSSRIIKFKTKKSEFDKDII